MSYKEIEKRGNKGPIILALVVAGGIFALFFAVLSDLSAATVEKTLPDDTIFRVFDDEVSPVETLKIQHVKPYYAADSSVYEEVITEATLNDMLTEKASLEARITEAQARVDVLTGQITYVQSQLALLPVRATSTPEST